ncbi:MAG: response regulator [Oscillospiraceae bacterium]|jgi:PAS domain S-box-containing protein|nr:response regulator [Oscillospiraceae bacterium]
MMKDNTANRGSRTVQLSLRRRFAVFSAVLFLLIVTIGSAAFTFSMRQIVKENKDNEVRRILEIERIKLENSLNSEIAIALKMADSPLIRQYFEAPGDAVLREIVFAEIGAYRRAFTAQTVFWINDIDKMFYFNDTAPYLLDPENPENYWYSMTLYGTEPYNFNINYNPDLNITNLWVNAPVYSDNGKPVGMIGTGIDLSTFLEMVYRDAAGQADIYFFNAAGEITGAKDAALVAGKNQIGERFSNTDQSIISIVKSLEPGQIHTLDSPHGKIALGAVPLLEWYAMAVIADSADDYYNAMTTLFLVMLVIIAIVFILCNAVIANLLRPLRKAMAETEASFLVAEYDIMKYRLISDSLSIAHWDMEIMVADDPAGPENSFKWSDEFRRMLGYSDGYDFPDTLNSWTGRLHPEDKERTLTAFMAHIGDRTGKTPYDLEYRLMLKNGTYRYFHAFGSTMRDTAGAPLRMAGAMRDITDRKLIEAELAGEYAKNKAAAHWYKSILDAIPLPISVTDTSMNWTFVNKAVEDFLGTKRGEMIGKPCGNWNAHICNTRDCGVACAKRGLMRTFFTHAESSYQVDVEILKDLKGETAGYIEIVQDITKIEAMAREQAEAENKAKSLFLASMSHEIRTPINAIIGMTAIGKNSGETDRKDYALNRIEEASSHLLGVINDILDMSKIEADKLELSPVEFDLESMIQKAVTVISFRVEEKRQRFTVDVDSKLPRFIIGDDQRLTQVIVNLLSNAVKFTPEGGEIRLGISLVSENDGICELRIEVADNGIGMSSEQQEKLFHAFAQADIGISREYGGTGLGLAISKRIVELMDGEILVESEFGRGTRFTVTVKARMGTTGPSLSEAFDAGSEDVRLREDAPDIRKGMFEGKTLLLAEDIEINREIIMTLLEDTGLTIDCAENGKEALDMIAAAPGRYDIVFMDMQMPQMDGLEAARRIRALPAPRGVALPIIAMTANVFKDDIENCLAAGMDDHIGKPVDIDTIIAKLRQYLRGEVP